MAKLFGEREEAELQVSENQVAEEMQAVDLQEGTPDPASAPVDGGELKDERKWHLADGTECSKSAFIREQFSVFNKSRKDISEEFDIPYRTVYGATVNMENAAEPTSRGRGLTFSKIKVDAQDQLVVEKDGVIFVNGEQLPEGAAAPETVEVDRNEWIKRQVAAGVERGKIAKMLDLSYGVIYGLTKDAEGTRQKYEVEYNGEMISRSEYIRRRVAEGVHKSDIAKELGVEYSVVWQATKKMKTTEEKFFDAVKNLEKFMDAANNPEAITEAIKLLNTVIIKEEEKNKVTESEAKGDQE